MSRYVPASYLAEQTGLSDRYWRQRAARGEIPGAVKLGEERGPWRFDRHAFWLWWHAQKNKGTEWQPSTGAAKHGRTYPLPHKQPNCPSGGPFMKQRTPRGSFVNSGCGCERILISKGPTR